MRTIIEKHIWSLLFFRYNWGSIQSVLGISASGADAGSISTSPSIGIVSRLTGNFLGSLEVLIHHLVSLRKSSIHNMLVRPVQTGNGKSAEKTDDNQSTGWNMRGKSPYNKRDEEPSDATAGVINQNNLFDFFANAFNNLGEKLHIVINVLLVDQWIPAVETFTAQIGSVLVKRYRKKVRAHDSNPAHMPYVLPMRVKRRFVVVTEHTLSVHWE